MRSLRYTLNGLSSLATAMPLVVEQYAFSAGTRYKFTFSGEEAPGLLEVDSFDCLIKADVSIYLDSSHLNQAIFRHRVEYGEYALQLSSDKASLNLDSSNYLRVVVSPYTVPGSGSTLASSTGSESTPETEVWVSKLLPVESGGNDLRSASNMAIRATEVVVLNIAAEVYDADIRTTLPSPRFATTGDNVYIYINFSSPIQVQAASKTDITLEIFLHKYSWAPENATWARDVWRPKTKMEETYGNPWDATYNYTQKLPYDHYEGSIIAFKFSVFAGAGYPNSTRLD